MDGVSGCGRAEETESGADVANEGPADGGREPYASSLSMCVSDILHHFMRYEDVRPSPLKGHNGWIEGRTKPSELFLQNDSWEVEIC